MKRKSRGETREEWGPRVAGEDTAPEPDTDGAAVAKAPSRRSRADAREARVEAASAEREAEIAATKPASPSARADTADEAPPSAKAPSRSILPVLLGALGGVIALAALGSVALLTGAAHLSFSTPLASNLPNNGTACTAACLTLPSGFHGLLLPKDASSHLSSNGKALPRDWDTHSFKVDQLVPIYDAAMKELGWTFLPAESTTDPRDNVGYSYTHLYCKPGKPPVALASIVIQGLSDTDKDADKLRQAQIIFDDLTPEGTCP